jgi:hypothetical protein
MGRALLFALLILPYAAVLATPLFNRAVPDVGGIPFFYWYQLLWIPLGSLLLFIVYRATSRANAKS